MREDLRYAWRTLWRDRSFALVAVLSLALGIGANTAIFSMVEGVLLRPLPYRDPGRLVFISQVVPKFLKAYPMLPTNIAMYMEWRKAEAFDAMAASRSAMYNLSGAGEPEVVMGARVSANMFAVLGVAPRLGRSFLEAEDAAGRDGVALVTDSLWRRRFNADPGIVGRKILLDGKPVEVAGVLPPEFRFPNQPGFGALRLGQMTEVFRPLGYRNEDLKLQFGTFNYWAIGRLRKGVSMAQASAGMDIIMQRLNRQFTEDFGARARLLSLHEEMVGDVRRSLVVIMAAVGLALLVLCVNLANLSLARAAGRARESAIRTALGAGRGRMVRQSLVESSILALAGGALGILLAYAGLDTLLAAAPVDLPRLSEIHLDGRVLAFALVLSAGAGLLFGLLPALRSAAAAPYEALKSGSHTTTEGRRGVRVRNTLVAAEVALSAILLVGAGLLLASYARLMGVDKGFDVDRVTAVDISLPLSKYATDAERSAYFDRALEQTRALPGVVSAGLVSALPFGGETWIDTVRPAGDARPLSEQPSTNVRFISPEYFRTLRIPLVAGRDIRPSDRERKVAVISAALGHKLWPGQDPVGRVLESGRGATEVVGVTADIRSTNLDRDPVNMEYLPYWTVPRPAASLVVRTAMDPRGLASTLGAQVRKLDGDVPPPKVRTLEQLMQVSVAERRFNMVLLGLFAAAALTLAALGTYGVVGYAVARRRAEMGIRMALGAGRGDLMRMILRQGMAPVFLGLAAGAAGALAAGTYMSSMLFGVGPRDPLSFAAAALVLLAVSAAACFIPARRATHANPIETLRFE
jgi:putative ABC transport system permease protein